MGRMLQISVPLSNGSSGGPLFNLKGEVIGVVTASLLKGQSLNFAVPINEVKPKLARFMDIPEPKPPVKTVAARPVEKKEIFPSIKTSKVYVVQPTDTLWGLSRRFNTSVEAIMKANNLKSSTIIDGQKLKIP
jgi:LysM repeat protein